MRNRTRGGIVRAVGVALAAALVAVGGAGGAQAAETEPMIKPTEKGSITIHKFEHPDQALNLPNNGMEQGIPDGAATPLAGVTFSVQQVTGYDLTTNAGWQALKDLTPTIAKNGQFGEERSVTTASDGTVTAGNLPVGVYLVTETEYPTGATPVAPFLVTVPLTDPESNDAWIYNVHVYPKNSISTATKTVDDDTAVKIGDKVAWTILGDIPEVDVIDGYKVVDQLGPKLDYVSTAVSLTDGEPLDPSDYTVTFDEASDTVTVLITIAGRAKLATHSEARVKVVITTLINDVGEITNEALVYPNKPSFDIQPGQPGGPLNPKDETKWGNVTIHKVAQTTSADLAGAVFAIFPTQADALTGTNAIQTSDPLPASGEWTFTGLRYSGWADGEAVTKGQAGYQSYWIAELKAPDGYELLAEPVEVVVDDFDTAIDYTVENVQSNAGFSLPLTGGMGTLALTAAGVLMIAGALLLAARNRRREAVAA